jgi:RND superfamily putative drug exporter
MISVFAAFALGDSPIIKMFGLGLATAVLLDATVVRMVIVPAVMTLFGDRAWRLPRWLDRVLPNLDVEGEQLVDRLEAHDAEVAVHRAAARRAADRSDGAPMTVR